MLYTALPASLCAWLMFLAATGVGQEQRDAHPTAPTPAVQRVVYPMQAALVQSLSGKSLAPGGHVLARLEKDWTDGKCSLARGTVVRGDVLRTEAWSSSAKRTSATLLFHYTCPGSDPRVATWIALLAADDLDLAGLHDGNPVAMQSFRSSSFGQSGSIGSAGNDQGSHVDMSGRQNPNLPVFLDPPKDHAQPRPKQVKTGEVWRVPDVSLEVGAGPDNSTVLITRGKSLHVPAGSAVVLLPEAVAVVANAPPPSPATGPTTARLAGVPAQTPRFHEITACERPSCTRDNETVDAPEHPKPVATLSLAGLQRHARRAAEMRDLAADENVVFLGRDRLLYTFDPHTLVTRDASDRAEDRPHTVRAILFDTASGKVERSIEWRVPDDRPYLWPVSADRVLIHSGHHLEWLGADLKPRTAFAAEGPIAFVEVAPDRQHFAVGVIHELHSHDEHAEVAAIDPSGPEEQIAVHVLDAALNPVSVSFESSRALPPVLLDRGRVMLLHMGGQRWHYKLLSWGETSQASGETVAYITSACLPRMSSAGADLLLVTGCDSKRIDHWYRVLRPDGTPVLTGVLHPQDLAPLAAGDPVRTAFAVALPSGGPRYRRNSLFHAEDLGSEMVRVHRTSDGAAVFAARLDTPVPESRPMALATDGDRLAVLDGAAIRIFALPAPHEASVPSPPRAGSH